MNKSSKSDSIRPKDFFMGNFYDRIAKFRYLTGIILIFLTFTSFSDNGGKDEIATGMSNSKNLSFYKKYSSTAKKSIVTKISNFNKIDTISLRSFIKPTSFQENKSQKKQIKNLFSTNHTDNILADTDTKSGSLLLSETTKTNSNPSSLMQAVFGDYIWLDLDEDGIQDNNESGVDGIRVELYRDNGDGIANPIVDSMEGFMLTANGGNYSFSNLSAGDYYAVCFLPDFHRITAINAGNNWWTRMEQKLFLMAVMLELLK